VVGKSLRTLGIHDRTVDVPITPTVIHVRKC